MERAVQDIAEWLTSMGLGEYAERFAENAIDFAVLLDLTEQDLKYLGMKLGHRRKMLRAISELDQTAHLPAERQIPPRQEAERRQLSILFCDLVGSTALTHRQPGVRGVFQNRDRHSRRRRRVHIEPVSAVVNCPESIASFAAEDHARTG